jgi:hypothetical protein
MQLVIRPLITAGVALAGASVVAVTPLTAPVPGLYRDAGSGLPQHSLRYL